MPRISFPRDGISTTLRISSFSQLISKSFNVENADVSVKHGYYEQFYVQIYSSEDYLIDLTSTFINLHNIAKEPNYEKRNAAKGLSYENCVLHNLLRQLSLHKWNVDEH